MKIVTIDKSNIEEYPTPCFMNCKNEGYVGKLDWLESEFENGLKIKQLYSDESSKVNGFIEYIPSEFCHRAVDCKNYLFIHCLWTYPNKVKNLGFGSELIQEVVLEAKNLGKLGVCVVVSKGSFMAGKDVFLKNDFRIIEEDGDFSLLVLTFDDKDKNLPKFKDYKSKLKNFEKGLYLLYSKQCPWVVRSANELKEVAKEKGVDLKIKELKNYKEVQDAPSIYAVFNLIYNGKVLADHYISKKRFENILNKL